MAARFRLVKYYNLPRYIYIYLNNKQFLHSWQVPFMSVAFMKTIFWLTNEYWIEFHGTHGWQCLNGESDGRKPWDGSR
jgi:hypothetical protein